jgi:hypothetical protein
MINFENNELHRKVASLESKVDMLESELGYLNDLLVRCGFPEGISTLKATVEDLLEEGSEFSSNENFER